MGAHQQSIAEIGSGDNGGLSERKVKMSNAVSHDKPRGVGRGDWIKRNYVSLLMVSLVIAISVCLFLYRDRVSELGNYGYMGAFLICLVSSATVILPVPGILLLFPLAVSFNPILVGLAGGIGGGIGEMTCYIVGYSGRGVVENTRLYNTVVQWLEKWGVLTVFVFALTPLPFDVLGIAAGLLHFPFWKFFIACWLGKTVLFTGMALAGAWGWEAFLTGTFLSSTLSIAALATLGVLLLLALALIIERWTWRRGR